MKKLLFTLIFLLIPFSAYADVSSDIEECRKNEWESRAHDCIEDIALELKDLSICEEAGHSMFECYLEFGLRYDDKTVCDKGEVKNLWRETCRELINPSAKTLERCMEIPDYRTQGECIFSLARLNNDPELCSEIYTKPIQELCIEALSPEEYEELSREKILDEAFKNCWGSEGYEESVKCINDAAVKHNSAEFCNHHGSNIGAVAGCATNVALAHKDPSACDVVDNEGFKSNCIIAYSLEYNAPELCEKVIKERAADCVVDTAEKYEDVTACDYLENEGVKKICIAGVGGEKLSESEKSYDCGSANVTDCLIRLAMTNDDPSYCHDIEDEFNNANCLKSVAVTSNIPEICYELKKESEASEQLIMFRMTQEECLKNAGVEHGSKKTNLAIFILLAVFIISIIIHIIIFNRKIGVILVPVIGLLTLGAGEMIGAYKLLYTVGFFAHFFELIIILNLSMIGVNFLYNSIKQRGISALSYYTLYILGIFVPIALPLLRIFSNRGPVGGFYIKSLGIPMEFVSHFGHAAIAGIPFLFCIYLLIKVKRRVPYTGGAGAVTIAMVVLLLGTLFDILALFGPLLID